MNNIQAAKAVSDIIRTTLGPRSMLKMLLDPMVCDENIYWMSKYVWYLLLSCQLNDDRAVL